MENFKCFLAMLLALFLFAMLATINFYFIADSDRLLAWVHRWKDLIDVATSIILTLTVLFAAWQLLHSKRIGRLDSVDRLLNFVAPLQRHMYEHPLLHRYMTDPEPMIQPRLDLEATRWCHDVTRHFLRAYMFRKFRVLHSDEMDKICYDIRNIFEMPGYRRYLRDCAWKYKNEDYGFWLMMEKERHTSKKDDVERSTRIITQS